MGAVDVVVYAWGSTDPGQHRTIYHCTVKLLCSSEDYRHCTFFSALLRFPATRQLITIQHIYTLLAAESDTE